MPTNEILRAIAIDPGVTTGYCVGIKDSNKLFIAPGEAKFTHSELFNFLQKWHPRQVICEEFEYRRGQRGNLILYSKELIGVVHLYCSGNVILEMKSAANVVGNSDYFNNAKLKKLDLHYAHSEHGRDAIRHLLHWFTFRRGMQFNEDNDTVLELVGENWLFDAYGR